MEAIDYLLGLVDKYEGFQFKAYQDQGGVWTIGRGHTGPEVKEGLVWTAAQVDAATQADAGRAITTVGNYVSGLNAQQLGAVADLVYNVGAAAFFNSTLKRLLVQGDKYGAAKEFQRWDHVNGRESAGLLRRRLDEALLFVEGLIG